MTWQESVASDSHGPVQMRRCPNAESVHPADERTGVVVESGETVTDATLVAEAALLESLAGNRFPPFNFRSFSVPGGLSLDESADDARRRRIEFIKDHWPFPYQRPVASHEVAVTIWSLGCHGRAPSCWPGAPLRSEDGTHTGRPGVLLAVRGAPRKNGERGSQMLNWSAAPA
jgi:hypothetical protein